MRAMLVFLAFGFALFAARAALLFADCTPLSANRAPSERGYGCHRHRSCEHLGSGLVGSHSVS